MQDDSHLTPESHDIAISFLCVVRKFKAYSHNNFQVCNIVLLSTVTILYIRALELILPAVGSLYSLADISPFPTQIFLQSIFLIVTRFYIKYSTVRKTDTACLQRTQA